MITLNYSSGYRNRRRILRKKTSKKLPDVSEITEVMLLLKKSVVGCSGKYVEYNHVFSYQKYYQQGKLPYR